LRAPSFVTMCIPGARTVEACACFNESITDAVVAVVRSYIDVQMAKV
jgi:hypothetical protein